MCRSGIGLLVVGTSLAALGAACSGDDKGPSESPLVIEKPATKSGDQQTGPVGLALGNPLRVLITRDGEPVEGVNVTWSAGQGGSIGDALESDELGIAAAVWTLGPGIGEHVATAEVDGADNSPLTYTATAEPSEPPPPPPGATVQVQSGNVFNPAIVTIREGQSVTWVWPEGSGLHNVVPDGEEPPTSGAPQEGPNTYTHTFQAPGRYRYHCSVHGAAGGVGMSGEVLVQAN
jgi:plastocyanin